MFRNVEELVSLAEIIVEQECQVSERTREEVQAQMERNLIVMEQAVEKGLKGVKSHSGLTGGDAVLLQD